MLRPFFIKYGKHKNNDSLGGTFCRKPIDDEKKPIAFPGRYLNDAEKWPSMGDLDFLGVVWIQHVFSIVCMGNR